MWTQVLSDSWHSLGNGVANFIPSFLAAIIIAIVGWIIGAILFKLIFELVKLARIDNALKAAGVEKYVEKAGFKLNSGYFLGKLVEWFVIIVFLVAALGVLGLTEVTTFLNTVIVGYLPQVIIAVIVIIIGAIVAEAVEKIVAGSAKAANIKSANFAGKIAKWAIWIFAFIAVLDVLIPQTAQQLVQLLVSPVLIGIALAFGLAFGLGGQDAAAKYIEKLKNDISER